MRQSGVQLRERREERETLGTYVGRPFYFSGMSSVYRARSENSLEDVASSKSGRKARHRARLPKQQSFFV